MRKTRLDKKLSLSRESLRLLQAPELGRVLGATLALTNCTNCTHSLCTNCCP
jgi:hypothetical protein